MNEPRTASRSSNIFVTSLLPASTRPAPAVRDATRARLTLMAELISIQNIDFDAWLAAWSSSASPSARRAATVEDLARVNRRARGFDASFPDSPCAICLATIECGECEAVLPCAHAYHAECIDRWFERSSLCPTCKRSVGGPKAGERTTPRDAADDDDEEEAPSTSTRTMRREIPIENTPMPAIHWTIDGETTAGISESERRRRYCALLPLLHELRREFETTLRDEIVYGVDAEQGAARVRDALEGLRASRTS